MWVIDWCIGLMVWSSLFAVMGFDVRLAVIWWDRVKNWLMLLGFSCDVIRKLLLLGMNVG